MANLLSVKEIYRVENENEAISFIEDEKAKAKEEGYILNGCSYTLKEKKKKGEVIDSGYQVEVKKTYDTFWLESYE